MSESSDYCDMCGAPMDQSAAPDAASASRSGSAPVPSKGGIGELPDAAGESQGATTQPCPSCALVNTADALFCEECGYDFTTGTMPRPATPTNALDLGQPPAATVPESETPASTPPPVPSAAKSTAPPVKVEWVAEVWVDPDWYVEQESDEPCPSPGLPVVVPLAVQSLLIGRRSRSRNIHPEIECQADVGVSRRQAQLTTDGQRWWVEDLQSSNGTYVGAASETLPTDAIPPGQRRELAMDDHIYVGAWTCIVVRRATPEEQAEQA